MESYENEPTGRGCMQPFMHKKIGNALFLVVLLVAAFLFVKIVSEIKAYSFIGGGVPVSNTITVSGEGEAFAVADTAQFSFSVVKEAKTVEVAQKTATKNMNAALTILAEADIDEKDIKTTAYTINPKYDYIKSVCTQFSCPPGKQELRGYEVRQSISVKVRDIDRAGQILVDIGAVGVTNVSGLTFIIDDEDAIKQQARTIAIQKAEEKARSLARDLGVRIIRVVSFSENITQPYYARSFDTAVAFEEITTQALAPNLPIGENKVTSNVNITYEIR